MATVYSSWKTISYSGGSFTCRSWISYTASQSNTKYILTVSAGYETQSSSNTNYYYSGTLYLTGTGQTTHKESFKDMVHSGTNSHTTILPVEFTWDKATSSASKTISAYIDSNYAATQSITVPALPRSNPTITNIVADRCTSSGVLDDEGEYAKISFNWSVDARYYTNVGVSYSVTVGSVTSTGSLSGTSGTVNTIVSASSDSATISVQVTDNFASTTKTGVLSSANFPIDINSTGTAVGILKPAPDGKRGLWTGYIESDDHIKAQAFYDTTVNSSNKTTLSLGSYHATGLLTSSSAILYFTIPTGRVFPTGTTVSKITFSIIARAGKSNGAGAYIIKNASGGTSSASFDSSNSSSFYDYADKPRTMTSSMWTKTLYGGTNVGITFTGSENYFFTGNSDNNAIINNQPVVVTLSDINIEFTLPSQ